MPKFLALVAYRCTVAGEATDSLDLQVQHFECDDSDQVRRQIEARPPDSYPNADGGRVGWHFASILAIEQLSPTEPGEEVVGAIVNIEELSRLTTIPPAA